jgi:hypothetical protein
MLTERRQAGTPWANDDVKSGYDRCSPAFIHPRKSDQRRQQTGLARNPGLRRRCRSTIGRFRHRTLPGVVTVSPANGYCDTSAVGVALVDVEHPYQESA